MIRGEQQLMKMDLMKGVIDMHVHTNPDLRLRAYDDFELMEAAIRVGARAIVIKTHQGSTVDRAYLCNRHNEIVHGKTNDFTMFGGITLNRVIGGMNPKAVDVALRMGAKVVWLPTQSAKNHLEKMKQDTSRCVEVIKDGTIVPELKTILSLSRDYDAVRNGAHLAGGILRGGGSGQKPWGEEGRSHPSGMVGCGNDYGRPDPHGKDYDVILERYYAQNMEAELIRAICRITLRSSKKSDTKMSWSTQTAARQKIRTGSLQLKNICNTCLIMDLQEQVYHMTHTIPAGLLEI